MIAVVGPGLVFVAALIRAAGIGTLDGDLDWASRPEAFVMVLGVPLFVATFIVLGRRTADRAPRAGITVTALGVLGVTALAAISGFRLFAASFVDAGFDPNRLNTAFEEEISVWDLGLLLFNVGGFVAWIVAGVVIVRTGLAPRWAGVCLIAGVPSVITAQAAYIALEVFWPLGTGLWLLGVWGVVASSDDST